MGSMTLDAGQIRVSAGATKDERLTGISTMQWQAFRLQKALREAGLDAHAFSRRGRGPGGWAWYVQLEAPWLVNLVVAVSRMPITRVRRGFGPRGDLENAGWCAAHPADDSWRTRVLRRIVTGRTGPTRYIQIAETIALMHPDDPRYAPWLATVPPARMRRATPLPQCTSVW